MIYRTVHNKDNPYFQLNRAAVNDERLSYKAIGIHTYLMSKPDGWEANEADIVRRHAEGRDSVRSGIKELADCGYLHRTRVTDDHGKVVQWRIDVYESPELNPYYTQPTDEPQSDFQESGEPQLENQESGKATIGFSRMWKNQNVENPTHSNYIKEVNKESSETRVPQTPQPEAAPSAPRRRYGTVTHFDPRLLAGGLLPKDTGRTNIEIWRESFAWTPTAAQIRDMNEKVTDSDKWRKITSECAVKGFRSYANVIDVYLNGWKSNSPTLSVGNIAKPAGLVVGAPENLK